MATKQTDTDPIPPPRHNDVPAAGPLTPSKIIAVQADPSTKGNTDPGVAPPANPPEVTVKPSGKVDSVDMLLDGVLHEKPQPPKIARESAGNAVASYQAQHELHRGVPTPPPEEKVILDLPKQSALPTLKIDRANVPKPPPGLLDGTEPPARPRGHEPTYVTPKRQGSKIVFALGGAALVTFAAFIGFKLWANNVKREAVLTDPTASALVDISRPMPTTIGKATAATTVTAPPDTTESPAPPPATTTAAAVAETAPPPASAAPSPPEPRATTTAASTAQTSIPPVRRVFNPAQATTNPPAATTTATAAPTAPHKTDLKSTLE